MRVTVKGILKGTNKSGREFFQIYGTTPFSEYEETSGNCAGVKTIDQFTFLDVSDIKINDEVDFLYEPGFQGRAKLTAIIPVKPAGKQ